MFIKIFTNVLTIYNVNLLNFCIYLLRSAKPQVYNIDCDFVESCNASRFIPTENLIDFKIKISIVTMTSFISNHFQKHY